MSAQFGTVNFDGKPVNIQELDRVRSLLAPYGPDSEGIFCKDGAGIIYRALHTTKESRRESQPYVSASGQVIVWDGRLDNRTDLLEELGRPLSIDSSDLEIVSAAYDRLGTKSFARLIGDWALCVYNPGNHSLILAKDFAATRHLHYTLDKNHVAWSTILDPLVLFSETRHLLNEEYLAGWLSFLPAPHLTPYVGIWSVPPASFVTLCRKKHTIKKYWDFDSDKVIRYRNDNQYEEHFRDAFSRAVGRRLRSDRPVLAELSGGMDSSSIVCMADTIIAQGTAETSRLDTLSYYNDSEQNWDERPYFTKVEQRRGQIGCHIDVSGGRFFDLELRNNAFAASPGDGEPLTNAQVQFLAHIRAHDHRAVLSGIGGDEVTGGVPTPLPELMDLLATMQFNSLASGLKLWALNKRKPWLHLFFETVRGFLPPSLVGVPKQMRPTSWLRPSFVNRNWAVLTGYPSRVTWFGSRPSFQENLSTLEGLRRQLAALSASISPSCERRYPYLDRDLLEFLFAIPREQLVRPGRRRSLMRRALAGIVPNELLERKRKAFVCRSPLTALAKESSNLIAGSRQMLTVSLGIVNADAFCDAVRAVQNRQEISLVAMARTLQLEAWLRNAAHYKTVKGLRPPFKESRNEIQPAEVPFAKSASKLCK